MGPMPKPDILFDFSASEYETWQTIDPTPGAKRARSPVMLPPPAPATGASPPLNPAARTPRATGPKTGATANRNARSRPAHSVSAPLATVPAVPGPANQ